VEEADPADAVAGGTSAVTDEGVAVADRADGAEPPCDPPDDGGGEVQAANAATNVTPATTRKNRSLTTRC
jgi:hypothetical protein